MNNLVLWYSLWDTSSIVVDSEFMDFQVFQVLARKSCTFLESEELLLVEMPFCCGCLCGYMFNPAFLAYLWNLWSLCRHFLRLVLPWFDSGCVRFEIHILSQAMVPVKQEDFCCCCWSFSRVLPPSAASMFSQTMNKMCYVYTHTHTHTHTHTSGPWLLRYMAERDLESAEPTDSWAGKWSSFVVGWLSADRPHWNSTVCLHSTPITASSIPVVFLSR